MIIVTGGAGFIGSNIVKGLNERGREDILVVDNLKEGKKFRNLADCEILDYLDKEDFIAKISSGADLGGKVDVIFHEGACSSTTEWDGKYIMRNNYEYSKLLLHYCLDKRAACLYASSASVYGWGRCRTTVSATTGEPRRTIGTAIASCGICMSGRSEALANAGQFSGLAGDAPAARSQSPGRWRCRRRAAKP